MRSKLTVSKKNSDTINLYTKDCALVKNLRGSSPRNNAGFLRKLADFLGNREFKDCNVEDMKRFITTVNYSDESKEPLKVAIRQFYCWLEKTEEYPPLVKWFTLKSQKERLEAREIDSIKKKIVPIGEYQQMISHVSGNMQNQAILETLYWSGCRIGELISMNLCDVELREDYVLISIRKSKTKKRQIPIKPIPELLIRWLDNHPMKSNQDAPLFISFNRRCWHQRLSVHYIEQEFRIICKELKLRRISPHCYRHTAVSRDFANGMPQTNITTKYGWQKDSVMFRVYDHNDSDSLIQYVTGKSLNTPPSIDILQQQKQRIEKEIKEKHQLETRLETLENSMKALNSTFGKMMLKPTNAYDGEKMVEFPGYDVDEVIRKHNQLKENAGVIVTRAVTNGVSQEEINKYKAFMNKLLS